MRHLEPLTPLRDALMGVLERLTLEPRESPPAVAPGSTPALETGSYLLDAGLGGVVPGRVCVVASSDRSARDAVLAELARTWSPRQQTAVILAGSEPARHLAATVLGAPSDVELRQLDTGLTTGRAWNRAVVAASRLIDDAPGCLLAGTVRAPEELEAAIAAHGDGAIGLILIDLDNVDLDALRAWAELGARRGFAVVVGLDPRSDAARRHDVPELSLARRARSPTLVRYAAHGVKVDGTRAPRLVVDVNPATLALTTYDPRNERHGGEPPEPRDLEWCAPELTWATHNERP